TDGANLDTWLGMSYQTVLTPGDQKTGNVIYPYEKALRAFRAHGSSDRDGPQRYHPAHETGSCKARPGTATESKQTEPVSPAESLRACPRFDTNEHRATARKSAWL